MLAFPGVQIFSSFNKVLCVTVFSARFMQSVRTWNSVRPAVRTERLGIAFLSGCFVEETAGVVTEGKCGFWQVGRGICTQTKIRMMGTWHSSNAYLFVNLWWWWWSGLLRLETWSESRRALLHLHTQRALLRLDTQSALLRLENRSGDLHTLPEKIRMMGIWHKSKAYLFVNLWWWSALLHLETWSETRSARLRLETWSETRSARLRLHEVSRSTHVTTLLPPCQKISEQLKKC